VVLDVAPRHAHHGQGRREKLLTLKQLGKDAGTVVVLAICTTTVFGALILSVYVWPYVLATWIAVVLAIGFVQARSNNAPGRRQKGKP